VVVADGDTFGGLFKAQTGQGLDRDRDTITGLGFTIIREDPRAGETKVWVYGPVASVELVINDYLLKVQLPGYFFPLPVGEEITEHLIVSWAPREDLFFA
jgi:hypothetical protein